MKIIWTIICTIWCGWFGVKIFDNIYSLPEKIFFALGLLVIFLIWYIKYNEKAKLKKCEHILSSAKYGFKIFHKYIKFDYSENMDGFEEYLNEASYEKIESIFTPIFKSEIEYSINQFKKNGKINSLCTLKIFEKEILNNFDKYQNTPVTFNCFLFPWYKLCLLPISNRIDLELENNLYFSERFTFGIHIDNRPDLESDPLNVHRVFTNKDDIPPFIKVYATLTINEQGELILRNCHSEYSNYYNYLKEINFKI